MGTRRVPFMVYGGFKNSTIHLYTILLYGNVNYKDAPKNRGGEIKRIKLSDLNTFNKIKGVNMKTWAGV